MSTHRPIRTPQANALAASLTVATTHGFASHAGLWRTRFAPAPTGHLHIGHVVNAVYVWGIARAFGGQVVLRVEDHDRTRCRTEYESSLLDDLDWLGLSPDIGSTSEFRQGMSSFRQSDKLSAYHSHLDSLVDVGAVYACRCSRREIASQTATESGVEARYSGTCRDMGLEFLPGLSRRVRVTGEHESFHDLRLGQQVQIPSAQCGDFVVFDRNGNFTYQFAVTVDDMMQNIDLVIRGEDLLSSSGRQLQLSRLLGRTVPPRFLHHPLVMRSDGLKLSKSLGDTGIREMRASGLSAADVLGRAAHQGGLVAEPLPIHAHDLKLLFL